MVVDISHVDSDSASERVLLSFDNFVVFSESFLEHSTCLKAEGVIEGDCKGKFDIDEVSSVGSFSLLAQVFLFIGNFLCLFQSI